MTRPVALTAIAIIQALFGIAAIVVVTIEPPMPGWPAWFSYWAGFAAVAHIVSALLLWRLRWLGPISFVLLWLGSAIVGYVLLRLGQANLTLLGSMVQVAILIFYSGTIFFYRAAFHGSGAKRGVAVLGSSSNGA